MTFIILTSIILVGTVLFNTSAISNVLLDSIQAIIDGVAKIKK
jgi:hypothetical protein